MTEHERIQALLDEGRISESEAALLFEALDDDPEVEAVLGTPQSTAQSENVRPPEPPLPPQPETPKPPPHEPQPTSAKAGREPKSGDVRWVKVEMFAGNLELKVDPSLRAPAFEGNAEMRRQGLNYEVRQHRRSSGRLGEGLLGEVLEDTLNAPFEPNETRRLELRVPEGYGVDLNMKAGNAEIHGVPRLRGKLVAGNLNVRDVGGITLDMKAGNLDASLKLTEGQHTLGLKAGGGRIRLLPGSSVQVIGEVKAGNFESPNPAFQHQKSYVGGTFRGTLGGGRARLTIQQKAGNLELVADDA